MAKKQPTESAAPKSETAVPEVASPPVTASEPAPTLAEVMAQGHDLRAAHGILAHHEALAAGLSEADAELLASEALKDFDARQPPADAAPLAPLPPETPPAPELPPEVELAPHRIAVRAVNEGGFGITGLRFPREREVVLDVAELTELQVAELKLAEKYFALAIREI